MSELDTQIEIAVNLQYLSGDEKQIIDQKIGSIAPKLAGLINHVKRKATKK